MFHGASRHITQKISRYLCRVCRIFASKEPFCNRNHKALKLIIYLGASKANKSPKIMLDFKNSNCIEIKKL